MARGSSLEDTLRLMLEQGADMGGKEFDSPQKLSDKIFSSKVDIVGVTFNSGLIVENCTFKNGLRLSAKAKSRVTVIGNRFEGESSIAVNAERFSLTERSLLLVGYSTLRTPLSIELGDLHTTVKDLHIEENGKLVLTSAERRYSGPRIDIGATVHPGGKMLLSNLQRANVSLAGISIDEKASVSIETYSGWLDLREISIAEKGSLTLRNVRMDKVTMAHTNLGRVDFDRVIWPWIHGRRATYDDLFYLQRWPHIGLSVFSSENLRRITPDDVADAYRQLISYYEARREYELAEDFYVNEMEVRRLYGKNKRRSWLGAALNSAAIYRFASLYGSSYRRALCVLGGLIVVFSVAFLFNGFQIGSIETGRVVNYDLSPRWGDLSVSRLREDFTTSLALTISIASLQKEKPAVPLGASGSILASTAAVTLTAQTALLLLALRRRFRRSTN
jgi:hypothetical protein